MPLLTTIHTSLLIVLFITLQIFVGGIDADVTEGDLMQPFSQFGEVVSVKIPVGKGCGFVQFGNRYEHELRLSACSSGSVGLCKVMCHWF